MSPAPPAAELAGAGAPARWRPADVARIHPGDAELPVIAARDVRATGDHDLVVWDMWQLQKRDGATVEVGGRQLWFLLSAPRRADPDLRHDEARIRLFSRRGDDWRDEGDLLPDGFSPGGREWSGSAELADDGAGVTLYFTATGRRGEAHSFEQRLFETTGRLVADAARPRIRDWTPPVEAVAADGRWYLRADQTAPVDGRIKGFRDPGIFHDAASGRDHLVFTGSDASVSDIHDGVIGHAVRHDAGGRWRLLPPLLVATGVNSELERPHIVVHGGRYHLFWSTQALRFSPDASAGVSGLYGMAADALEGPWRPLNGSGLVAANPAAEPTQAYCWWVTGELEVLSFVDVWGAGGRALNTAAERAERFGGVMAPVFRLHFEGDRAEIVAP